jgi:hypothetical protein
MYDLSANSAQVTRALRPAKDSSDKQSKPERSAYRSFLRREALERRNRARARAITSSGALPDPLKAASAPELEEGIVPSKYNLEPFSHDYLHHPEWQQRVTLYHSECNLPLAAEFKFKTIKSPKGVDHQHVLVGNHRYMSLVNLPQLLELEQTGRLDVNLHINNINQPIYYYLRKARFYYRQRSLEQLNAAFPRIPENIYFVPKNTARRLVLVDYQDDVPINVAKFTYLYSVCGVKEPLGFLTASEYSYHFRLFRNLVYNKEIYIPQLRNYKELTLHENAPCYERQHTNTIELSFPTFVYHDSAPDYSSASFGR